MKGNEDFMTKKIETVNRGCKSVSYEGQMQPALINTPIQRGAGRRGGCLNPEIFRGFRRLAETAKAVAFHRRRSRTPLKRGVNENCATYSRGPCGQTGFAFTLLLML